MGKADFRIDRSSSVLRQTSRHLAAATALAFVGSTLAGTVAGLPSALADSGLTPQASSRGAGELSARDVALLQAPVVAGQADIALAGSVGTGAPVQVITIAPEAVAAAAAATAAAAAPAAAGPAAAAVATRSADAMGIPGQLIDAYKKAADATNQKKPGCGIDWMLLAAIGKIESNHAQGGKVDANGTMAVKIAGPQTRYGTAKGPMQFIDSTWASSAQDGNGDGVKDVYNIHDAALAAGIYLCQGGGGSLTDAQRLHDAIFSYNRAEWYVQKVLALKATYAQGVVPTTTAPLPAVPIVPPTESSAVPSPAPAKTSKPAPTQTKTPPATRPTTPAPAPTAPTTAPTAPMTPPTGPPAARPSKTIKDGATTSSENATPSGDGKPAASVTAQAAVDAVVPAP